MNLPIENLPEDVKAGLYKAFFEKVKEVATTTLNSAEILHFTAMSSETLGVTPDISKINKICGLLSGASFLINSAELCVCGKENEETDALVEENLARLLKCLQLDREKGEKAAKNTEKDLI